MEEAEAEAGMEKPTTDEVGRVFFTPANVVEEEPEGAEDRRRDAHDFLTGGAGAGTSVTCGSLGKSTWAGAESVLTSLGAAETDVFVDAGDPGIVDASVVSVAAEDGIVELGCEGEDAYASGVSGTSGGVCWPDNWSSTCSFTWTGGLASNIGEGRVLRLRMGD